MVGPGFFNTLYSNNNNNNNIYYIKNSIIVGWTVDVMNPLEVVGLVIPLVIWEQ
jgi:hypothetical protein